MPQRINARARHCCGTIITSFSAATAAPTDRCADCNHSGKAFCFCPCLRFMRQSVPRASAPRLTRISISPCLSRRSCRRISMNAACTSALQGRMCCGAKRSFPKCHTGRRHASAKPYGTACAAKSTARRCCWRDLRVCSAGRQGIRFCWMICMTYSALWRHAAMCATCFRANSVHGCGTGGRRTRCACFSMNCLPEVLNRDIPTHSAAAPIADGAAKRPASQLHAGAKRHLLCRYDATPVVMLLQDAMLCIKRRTATRPPCAKAVLRPGRLRMALSPCFRKQKLL